ncbi:MAG: DciA family protein, partial [Acetobacteraceae bacterium]
VPGLTRAAFRRRAPATAQVLADWPAIVGPALAAETTPRRLAAGTLTLACSGPIALELQHLSGELLGRINAHVGHEAVRRLRFVQTAPERSVSRAEPLPAPEANPAADQAVVSIPEGALRTALASLGRVVLSPNRHRSGG